MSLPIAAAVRSGDLLDHYRLEQLVAAGGMAYIFRATEVSTGGTVAVKIPHAGNGDDGLAVDRLRREANIAKKLNHPGIAKVLADGGANHPYLVMEWVDGELLRAILDQHLKLAIDRATRITLEICEAIEYVHSCGLAHHDLKPDNVMICADDHIKLFDFGIACETRRRIWRRSGSAPAAGTPDYTSPERIKGRPADARSDIYSVGIMLYEMLTGEVPFSGLDPSVAINLRLQIDAPLCGGIDPAIPMELQKIVHRAIARDRAKRYASAREFAVNLSEVFAQETAVQPVESFANF